ncbi:MAG: TusE/DsrC/DsvC family sulfur relay protein [Oligoflexia bacterium]|nr:TusE/DsrC/DsvC family sulfur relay protein [Oligoflexia bacterium]
MNNPTTTPRSSTVNGVSDSSVSDSSAPQLAEQLARMESKLDRMMSELDYLSARQRRMEELVDEGMPIAREAMRVAGIHLDAIEAKGYVSLVKAMKQAMDNVVGSYQPDDFQDLADNMVGILEVVRGMTQPQALAIADQAADVLNTANEIAPVSVFKAISASREEEVQRGMAVGLQLLRQIGRVTSGQASSTGRTRDRPRTRRAGVSTGLDARLASRLAPSRRAVRTAPAEPTAPQPAAASPTVAQAAKTINGVALDAQGFLADPSQWTREFAELVAAAEGVELTQDAWAMVSFARDSFLSSGAAPNIRKITKGMGIETRAIYTAFPKAPGKTIARIAGIPKPVGCI